MRRSVLIAAIATALPLAWLASGVARGRGPLQTTARGGPSSFPAEIRLGSPVHPANRRLLGSNIQWVDRGDGLLAVDGSGLDPEMLALVEGLAPTVLRYPGGSHADTFDWRAGLGPIGRRGSSEHFLSHQRQPILFGPAEFLDLCRRLGAEPLLTVNVATGSAADAAEWVRATNRPGGVLGSRVQFWEIGNEPYLKEDARPELAVEPRVFAARANAFIKAMRDADPAIAVGLPLRRDRLGVLPAVAFPGFADAVLASVDEAVDFYSLHNAYMPFVTGNTSRLSSEDLFAATMAAYRVVEDDLRETRQLIARHRPRAVPRFAITEYNAFYTVGGALDDSVATLGGAMYIADLLRLFAQRDDVLMANFWSLTANWWFGAVAPERRARPAYEVLRAYSQILRGQVLSSDVVSPTFVAPPVGAVPSTPDVPMVAALATVEGRRTRLMVINKNEQESAVITLRNGPSTIDALRAFELTATAVFDVAHQHALVWRGVPAPDASIVPRFTMAPHSLLWVEIDAAR